MAGVVAEQPGTGVVDEYLDERIVGITAVTGSMGEIAKCLDGVRIEAATRLVPVEEVYPVISGV